MENTTKYRDYNVEILELDHHTHVGNDSQGRLMKFTVAIHRIPSLKVFRCRIYQGLTAGERAATEHWCRSLPAGEWARFPDLWKRAKGSSGRIFFRQHRGIPVDVDWIELELQMMIDITVDVEASGPDTLGGGVR
jgi:hypothetical protein